MERVSTFAADFITFTEIAARAVERNEPVGRLALVEKVEWARSHIAGLVAGDRQMGLMSRAVDALEDLAYSSQSIAPEGMRGIAMIVLPLVGAQDLAALQDLYPTSIANLVSTAA